MTDARLAALRWDAEYRGGRYVAALDDAPSAREGVGLYVGCGNGRNYLPLVDAGLRLIGLDLSPEALRQLAARRSPWRRR